MAPVKRSKRSYRSERRNEQAASTQSAILDAARERFSERGYSGTTIEAIAEAAGVAAITVYSVFGSKRALLARLIGVALVGDEKPVPLLERLGLQGVLAARDQRTQMHLFAVDISGILRRVAPVMEVMSQAAATEPDIAELRQNMLRQRLANIQVFSSALRRNGPLRNGMSAATAAQTVWAVSSPEVYLLATRHLGWSHGKYVDWLDNSLSALVLAPSA